MIQEPVSAGEVAGALREILSDPEFEVWREPLASRIRSWILDTLGEWWRWLMETMPAGGRDFVGLVFFVGGFILLLWLLGRWAGSGPVLGRRATKLSKREANPRTAAEWFGLASHRAGRGRYRRAASALYQGILLALDGTGALEFHASKTPGEYAREARSREPGGVAARSFFRGFQVFSFGQDEATEAGYRELEELSRQLGADASAGDAGEGET